MREEQKEVPGEHFPPGQSDGIRDGSADFSQYSVHQLNELRFMLSRSEFPLNYANLVAELERRAGAPSPSSPEAPQGASPGVVTVRFTAHGGLQGWLEARSRRLPLYGEGFVEVRPEELVLGGWQRNWLGVAQRSEISVPLNAISDVVQGDGGTIENRREAQWVRLRYETPLGRNRFLEFDAGSIPQASALVEALPKARSHTYERWTAVREFDSRLREVGGRPWITRCLVLVNVVVFAAMVAATRHVDFTAAPQVIDFGANFGPLTLHGQWWRLLTALFIHGNIAHVFFNMWALWNIGRFTERLYGSGSYAILYVACGVLSGLASIVWDPSRPTVGASGAIFGIFAAFVVFALQRHRRVTVRVPPALWISTSIFMLYSLAAGFLTPGVDNAAHVGGFVSGLVLGACLVRPFTAEARRQFPAAKAALAAGVTAVGVVGALWQATGLGDQLTGPERYHRSHEWLATGEAENLRNWQQLASSAAAGFMTENELAERFQREILPFWETTSARLEKEQATLPSDEREYGSLFADYAKLRARWARAVIDIAQGNSSRMSEVTQYERESYLAVARTSRVALLASLDHRPRALASSPWIIAASNWLTRRRWQCVEPELNSAYRAPRSGDSSTDGPAARHAAGCRAQKLFLSADYVALDHWMEQSADSLEDLPDGGSTLDGIVRGLSTLFDSRTLDPVPMLGRTADWQRRVPKSIYPVLIQSLIFQSWAWQARGQGYASSITRQTWVTFAERTEMAAMGLREIAERANTDPLWYALSLDVGLDESKKTDELLSIFHRGIVEHPGYWPLYSRTLRILMPRWLGSEDDIHQFIDEVSLRLDGTVDTAKYAKLYWSYSSLEDDKAPLFGGTLADWPKMKAGFLELQRRHPASDYILNAYAKFACMAEDEAAYTDVRPKLSKRVSSVAWLDAVTLAGCDGRFAAAAAAARGHKFTPPKFGLR